MFAHARNYSLPAESDRVLTPNVVLMDNAGESVTAFGGFFTSVSYSDDHHLSPHIPTNNFQLNITLATMQSHLERMSVNKSSDTDGIHPQLLNILSVVIKKPIALLFNLSLKGGVIPNK